MTTQSLHQLMNDMAARIEAIDPSPANERAPEPLSELEAFMQMDGLLASLNKQYLEAKSQRQELVALNGAEDAMAEVAMDMEDSAWCAMQTRYLEVRNKRELMEEAQYLMRQREKKIEEMRREKIKHEKERAAQQYLYYNRIIEQVKEKNKNKDLHFFEVAFLLLWFKLLPQAPEPSYKRQQLAAA